MKNKEQNFNKGRYGEKVALEYLLKKGYTLVDQNFSTDLGVKGEIDLIMKDKDRLVFVEVKYKYNDRLGVPEEMIDKRKIAKVKRIADVYIVLKKPQEEQFRIDAVCILGNLLKHYENIG
ncbi:MAG: YraN family protein [Candidatus Shapirobacteria bacterium]